ncbi:MAG: FUSC family protein [Clostridiales Family XIII bacterium]|nr:FUSC family protein [Clostridiales Family XIII bacterium]
MNIKSAIKRNIHRFILSEESGLRKLFRKFPIGMRNVKTALAVGVCLVIYYLAEKQGLANNSDAFLACVAAIICMQDSVKNSITMGISRLIGTFFGVVIGVIILHIDVAFSNDILHIVLIGFGIMVIIAIFNEFKIPKAIVISCVVFLMMTLTPPSAGPFVTGFQRLFNTVIAIVVAVAINRLIRNPDKD